MSFAQDPRLFTQRMAERMFSEKKLATMRNLPSLAIDCLPRPDADGVAALERLGVQFLEEIKCERKIEGSMWRVRCPREFSIQIKVRDDGDIEEGALLDSKDHVLAYLFRISKFGYDTPRCRTTVVDPPTEMLNPEVKISRDQATQRVHCEQKAPQPVAVYNARLSVYLDTCHEIERRVRRGQSVKATQADIDAMYADLLEAETRMRPESRRATPVPRYSLQDPYELPRGWFVVDELAPMYIAIP